VDHLGNDFLEVGALDTTPIFIRFALYNPRTLELAATLLVMKNIVERFHRHYCNKLFIAVEEFPNTSLKYIQYCTSRTILSFPLLQSLVYVASSTQSGKWTKPQHGATNSVGEVNGKHWLVVLQHPPWLLCSHNILWAGCVRFIQP
jgi:hypothetical protein